MFLIVGLESVHVACVCGVSRARPRGVVAPEADVDFEGLDISISSMGGIHVLPPWSTELRCRLRRRAALCCHAGGLAEAYGGMSSEE